jgi:Homeodomain-like domain
MDCSCCCNRRKGAGRLVVGHDKWHSSIALFDSPDGVVGSRHQRQQDDSGVSRDHLERILEAAPSSGKWQPWTSYRRRLGTRSRSHNRLSACGHWGHPRRRGFDMPGGACLDDVERAGMKQRMKHPAQTVKQVERADRQAQALDMHAAGATYREIGAELQCSPATVCRLITSAIRETPSVAVRDFQSIVFERVDQVHEANVANAHVRHTRTCSCAPPKCWLGGRALLATGTAVHRVGDPRRRKPAPAARRDTDLSAIARQAGRR